MPVHDYSTGELPGLDDPHWSTVEMQELFTVHAFAAPFVHVTRKSDGVRGSLQFNHNPRLYFNFTPTTARERQREAIGR